MNQTFPSAGAVKIGIMNSAISTSRGIHVGDSREKVVRSYGRPAQIVWNGPQKQLYLIYEKDAKQLIFTIQDNRAKEIQLSFAGEEFPVSHPEAMTSGLRFTDEDFCIAGYRPETDFQEHSWLIWEKKAANPEEEIWYFPGFGVRMDSRTRRISSLFITDNGMVTHRGISLGDQLSTLEFLYGEPQKLEMNLADTHPQSAYIYFSKDKETVLVFYINEKEKTIQNIVSMKNPQIPNPLQPTLDRIRNVRTINQQRGKDWTVPGNCIVHGAEGRWKENWHRGNIVCAARAVEGFPMKIPLPEWLVLFFLRLEKFCWGEEPAGKPWRGNGVFPVDM